MLFFLTVWQLHNHLRFQNKLNGTGSSVTHSSTLITFGIDLIELNFWKECHYETCIVWRLCHCDTSVYPTLSEANKGGNQFLPVWTFDPSASVWTKLSRSIFTTWDSFIRKPGNCKCKYTMKNVMVIFVDNLRSLLTIYF